MLRRWLSENHLNSTMDVGDVSNASDPLTARRDGIDSYHDERTPSGIHHRTHMPEKWSDRMRTPTGPIKYVNWPMTGP